MSIGVRRTVSRRIPLLMAVACLLAVGIALVAQNVFDMRPCPWCILQRLVYLVIALVCLTAAFMRSRRIRMALNVATLSLAGGGILAAVYQHEVAAKMYSCDQTFADILIRALRLESLWPDMFQVTGTCAEAAVSVLGVPFEYWSLGLFALLALVSAGLVLRSIRVSA